MTVDAHDSSATVFQIVIHTPMLKDPLGYIESIGLGYEKLTLSQADGSHVILGCLLDVENSTNFTTVDMYITIR